MLLFSTMYKFTNNIREYKKIPHFKIYISYFLTCITPELEIAHHTVSFSRQCTPGSVAEYCLEAVMGLKNWKSRTFLPIII